MNNDWTGRQAARTNTTTTANSSPNNKVNDNGNIQDIQDIYWLEAAMLLMPTSACCQWANRASGITLSGILLMRHVVPSGSEPSASCHPLLPSVSWLIIKYCHKLEVGQDLGSLGAQGKIRQQVYYLHSIYYKEFKD